jgi:alpha-mannosidase
MGRHRGLRGAIAGPAPLLEEDRSLVTIEPGTVLLSALKPAGDGNGFVVRVLNPSEKPAAMSMRFGFPVAEAWAVRLDETKVDAVAIDDRTLRSTVPARALRSFRIVPAGPK